MSTCGHPWLSYAQPLSHHTSSCPQVQESCRPCVGVSHRKHTKTFETDLLLAGAGTMTGRARSLKAPTGFPTSSSPSSITMRCVPLLLMMQGNSYSRRYTSLRAKFAEQSQTICTQCHHCLSTCSACCCHLLDCSSQHALASGPSPDPDMPAVTLARATCRPTTATTTSSSASGTRRCRA